MLIIEIAGTRLESIMAARNKDTDKYDISRLNRVERIHIGPDQLHNES